MVAAIWLGHRIYKAYGVARAELAAETEAEAERLDGLRTRGDELLRGGPPGSEFPAAPM